MKNRKFKLQRAVLCVGLIAVFCTSMASCTTPQITKKIPMYDKDGNVLVGLVIDYGEAGLSDDLYGYLKVDGEDVILVDPSTKNSMYLTGNGICKEDIFFAPVKDLLSKGLADEADKKGSISEEDFEMVKKYYIPNAVGDGINLYSENLSPTKWTKLAYALERLESPYYVDEELKNYDYPYIYD